MFFRILRRSFHYRRKSMALIILSVTMGASIASSLLTIALEVSDKVAKELRNYGANILIEPEEVNDYLHEGDLLKIKTIFWRHNIVNFAPYLSGVVTVWKGKDAQKAVLTGTWFGKMIDIPGQDEPLKAGTCCISPWWKVKGRWIQDGEEGVAMVGSALASRLGLEVGDEIKVVHDGHAEVFRTAGIVTTGGLEEGQVFVNLCVAQRLMNLSGRISRVLVSAVTVPMDGFARRNPRTMTPKELERWYCTPYVTSVAKQLEGVFRGGKARPIWQIAESEGKILSQFRLSIALFTIVVLFASCMAVSTTMISNVLERRDEIGLMKALGADSLQIVSLFLSEALFFGLVGGVIGYFMGIVVVHHIGLIIFGTALESKDTLLIITMCSSLLVTLTGSLVPVRRALGMKSDLMLRGRI